MFEKIALSQRSDEEHEQVIIKVNEVQKLAVEKGKSELIGQGIAGLILGNTLKPRMTTSKKMFDNMDTNLL